jgi:hypothetical protein
VHAIENQQHALSADCNRAHPNVPEEKRESKNVGIEAARAIEVVHIKRRF